MFNHPFQIITQDDISIHFLSFKNALLNAVRQAHKRVWVLCYVVNCNLNREGDPITFFFRTLQHKKKSGCDIKIIIDDPKINRTNYHTNKYMLRKFMEWEFAFKTPPQNITSHAKCILIDDKVLFIGSHNLAKSSLLNPLDCTVEIHNDFLIKSFAETYQELWQYGGMITYLPEDLPQIKHDG